MTDADTKTIKDRPKRNSACLYSTGVAFVYEQAWKLVVVLAVDGVHLLWELLMEQVSCKM